MPEVFRKLLVLALLVGFGLARQPLVSAQDDAATATEDDSATDDPPQEQKPKSVLLAEPKTPDEMFDAVLLMLKLARPKLARGYLDQFIAAKPDDAFLLKLRDKHGPAVFLKLANAPELKPVSSKLLERMNRIFRQQGADPKRIDALISGLQGDAEQRETAVIALKSGGAAVVPRILMHLSDPRKRSEHDLLLYTLTKLGDPVVPPLLGAIDAPDESMRTVAIEALGWLGAKQAVAELWFPAFDGNSAAGVRQAAKAALARILKVPGEKVAAHGVADELQRLALECFSGKRKWQVDDGGRVSLWSWSAADKTVSVSQISPEAASLFVGRRYALQALSLSPEKSAGHQSLYLGLLLATDRHKAGWENPLPVGPGTAHNLALKSGPDVVAGALSLAMDHGNSAAALAALQVLGQIGSRHQLANIDGRKSPLIAALDYPDSRVQFSAAAAILEIDPTEPFRGAARVVSILTRALKDEGAAQALIVHPNAQRARTFATLLGEEFKYEPQIAATGRGAFQMAAARNDIELIVLNVNVSRWPLSQTVANLRADARTESIPIVLFGKPGTKPRIEGLMKRYPPMTYVVESTTSENVEIQLKPFIDALKPPSLTPRQRSEQISTAVFWFAQIADGQRTAIYDIRGAEAALFQNIEDEELAQNALRALGAIGTRTARGRLHDAAVAEARSSKVRVTAALQLAFHIQRFSMDVKLSGDQIRKLGDAWAKAQADDPTLATALSSVIGSLKPDSQKTGARLKAFPQPKQPEQRPAESALPM